MTEFLIYQGKAAIALAVFYMFYRLLLSKETFHRFNRIVLLSTAALSFVLPLCVITFKEVVVVPAMTASSETFTGEVAGTAAMVPEVSEPIWSVILCSLFALGALAVLIHVVISIIGIRRMIRSGNSQALESGETLIITETDTAPFSWMKYIVISREDYESGYSQILTHEKAHIALRHSWDILFVDMITALQWFNPAIWMLKADLRALHEFEADDAVLRSGANIKEYQYLLIRKAVSKSGYSVANSFNHSTLKARITMMLNKKSSRMSAWKALYVIPLVGISLAATAETKVDYQYEDQQHVAVTDTLEGKDSKNSLPEPESEFTKKNLREGRFIVDEENNTFTLHYFDADCKELQVHYTGLDLNKNIYMHNGAIVTQDMMMKAAKDDPDAVVIVAYLKGENRVSVAVTKSGPYVTGTINAIENQEGFTLKSSIKIRTADEEETKVDANLVIVVNGERMPEGFDLNTIDPKTIASMEVLKTEKALQEYGTDKGVIVITTDPSKANEKKPAPDIYIDGKKVCGILTEGVCNFETGLIESAIIGIGINIANNSELPQDVAGGVISGDENNTKRSELAAGVISELLSILDGGEESIKKSMEEYKSRSFLIGQEINVSPVIGQTENDYICKVLDITEEAKLVVELEDGSKKTLDCGEVSIHSKKM